MAHAQDKADELDRVTDAVAVSLEALGVYGTLLRQVAESALPELIRKQREWDDKGMMMGAVGLQVSVAVLCTQMAVGLLRGAPEAVLSDAIDALRTYRTFVRGTTDERQRSALATELAGAMAALRQHVAARTS